MKRLLIIGALLALVPTSAGAYPGQTFHIGFTVNTARHTNVLVHWKVWCDNGQITAIHRGRFEAITPISRSLRQSLPGATTCHVRVVAWDIHPWNPPWQDGQRPVVRTEVTPT